MDEDERDGGREPAEDEPGEDPADDEPGEDPAEEGPGEDTTRRSAPDDDDDERDTPSSASVHTELAVAPPGATPGTLLIENDTPPTLHLVDYDTRQVHEHELDSIDEVIEYLSEEHPTVTWIDVRGIGHRPTFERIGEVFGIHPLALEDMVNAPQRPKSDEYPTQQLLITRMVNIDDDGTLITEQLAILFGRGFVLTVQEEPRVDCLDPVRERIRGGRGSVRRMGSDYLAYAIFDAIIDGFYPVLEKFGERLEELELKVSDLDRPGASSTDIFQMKRDLLTLRRAIWPQRDLLATLLRDPSRHITDGTRVYLRDTYDHAVQVMDMVETFREITSGLMDLYMTGVSHRLNEVMKVLTILSTIFLPMTFVAGVYGMNFDGDSSPLNMPELRWRYGYPLAILLMVGSAVGLLAYYRSRGWLGATGTWSGGSPRARKGKKGLPSGKKGKRKGNKARVKVKVKAKSGGRAGMRPPA